MIDQSLKLLHPNGGQTVGRLSGGIIGPDAHRCQLDFDHPQLGHLSFTEFDFFRCLQRLRSFLDQQGIKALCNGARVNAFVSGMAGQMGYGLAVYLVTPGKPIGDLQSLVPLFGESSPEAVTTVEAQQAFQDSFWQAGLR
jgi:hypothetical protein